MRRMKDRQPPSPNSANSQSGKWIPIALFPDEVTAHLASSRLDAEGIKTILANEVNPIVGNNPTGISVRSDDVKAAIAVLTDSPAKRWLVSE
jgi:hypothetical protein